MPSTAMGASAAEIALRHKEQMLHVRSDRMTVRQGSSQYCRIARYNRRAIASSHTSSFVTKSNAVRDGCDAEWKVID
jgi:hypothetical protein